MSNIISATFSCGSTTASAAGLWQYDYGQRLVFAGLDLPPVYEVHFASEGDTETVTVLGDETGVDIPDQFLLSGSAVRAWVFLHTGTEDGETMYAVRMPVNRRPEPSDVEPTPVQQDIITQAIAALDAAVEQTGQDVETTAGYMDRAEQAAEQAEQAAQGVEDYAERAETAAANAEASATSAGQSEQAATQAATAAVTAATQAGTSAGQAQQAASDAGQAATQAADAASAAGMFATTAEAKAEEATASASAAAGSASSAAGSETVASQAAQTATQKASEASQSATSASNSATSAAQSATSAEQSAQSAEQSAESILDVLPEIQQDITDLQDTKADKDGSYDYLTAGLAKQLATDQGITDSVPYLMRPSGGGVAVGTYEQDKIVGGSVVWNQLCPKTAASKTVAGGVSVVNNGDGSFTFSGTSTSSERFQFNSGNDLNAPANHVLFIGGISGGSGSTFYLVGSYNGSLRAYAYNDTVAKSSYAINQFSLRVMNGNTFDTPITVKPQLVDLTAMFGPTIADYIHSLETATAGAGVAWLKQHFPEQFNAGYQEYNAGEIKSVGGLVSHDTSGFNQWDEEWESGAISSSTGQNTSASGTFRSTNYIPILPDTAYYAVGVFLNVRYYDANKLFIGTATVSGSGAIFTTPSNAHYMRFYCTGAAYANNICINLSSDRNGEYEEGAKHSYPLDTDLVLRGIPKLDANNQLYYDGDTYSADGTVERKFGITSFASAKSVVLHSSNYYYTTFSMPDDVLSNNNAKTFISNGYKRISTVVPGQHYIANAGKILVIVFLDQTMTDLATVNNYLADNPITLIYELATPTTEQAAPYQISQLVDPDGTEEYVLSDGAFPMPVGHETFYPVDLKKKIEDLPDSLVSDVQVDGVSVVQGGVANVPQASDAEIKAGQAAKFITANSQFKSAFYGLAKAAGDATQSASSNAVGTYTDAAKVAIQKMLGIYEAPWELIREDTFTNETAANHEITVDSNGQPFELTDIRLVINTPTQETQSGIADYGRIYFYYTDALSDIMYINSYTQAAGATGTTSAVSIEQSGGMIQRISRKKTSNNGEASMSQLLNINTSQTALWEMASKTYKKIQINAVTGTCHYKLFGKRKW